MSKQLTHINTEGSVCLRVLARLLHTLSLLVAGVNSYDDCTSRGGPALHNLSICVPWVSLQLHTKLPAYMALRAVKILHVQDLLSHIALLLAGRRLLSLRGPTRVFSRSLYLESASSRTVAERPSLLADELISRVARRRNRPRSGALAVMQKLAIAGAEAGRS